MWQIESTIGIVNVNVSIKIILKKFIWFFKNATLAI